MKILFNTLSFLKAICAGHSALGWQFISVFEMHLLSSLLADEVSAEKSVFEMMEILLNVIWHYSLEVSRILVLLCFDSLMIMCYLLIYSMSFLVMSVWNPVSLLKLYVHLFPMSFKIYIEHL